MLFRLFVLGVIAVAELLMDVAGLVSKTTFFVLGMILAPFWIIWNVRSLVGIGSAVSEMNNYFPLGSAN